MKVRLLWLKLKNVRSYGNSITTFSFENGIHQICGPNGGGKSSLLDALSFNWFGIPFSKIKIAELINDINGKNLYTESCFEIDNDTYIIKRGLKPNILTILHNGEELELLSTKTLVQENINNILGITHMLFKQIIALSINANKPFLTLAAYEQRNIVETIFNIDIFGAMMKSTKKTIAELKVVIKIKSSELKSASDSLDSFRKQVKDYTAAKTNFDTDKQRDLTIAQNAITDYNTKIKSCETNISLAKQELKTLDKSVESYKKVLTTTETKITELNYETRDLQSKIKFFDIHKTCVSCGQHISDDHKKIEISAFNKRLDIIKELLITENTYKLKLTNLIDDYNKKLAYNTTVANLIERQQNYIQTYKNELKKTKKIENNIINRELQFNVDEILIDLKKKEDSFIKLSKYVTELNDDYNLQNTLQNILSETGVKSHFMHKLLPLLNQRINFYLDKFEMPFIFNFNDTLEENIVSLTGKQKSKSYESCSMGEKKRFDLSIIFSFIDIIKTISGWDCNVLFIDELLDSAVDVDNLKLIMDCIKLVFKENPTLCSYIISHRQHDSDIFDRMYYIDKQSSFSIIKENVV